MAGCHISDIAPDRKLNEKMSAFFKVEMLEMSPGYSEFQKKILRDSGLDDETPDTILEMKHALSEHRERERAKEEGATKVGRRRRR